MINLKEFKETYLKLEEKSLKIMEIYGIGCYDLRGIGVEEFNSKTLFNIETEHYISGCGSDFATLEFELDEMNEPLEYFKAKRLKQLKEEEKRIEEEKQKSKKIKEVKEKAKYEELRRKFG